MPSQELIAQRASVVESIRALHEATAGRVMSGEERAAFERMTNQYDEVQENIAAQNRAESILGAMDAPAQGTIDTRAADNETVHPLTPNGPAGTGAMRGAVAASRGGMDFGRAHEYERAFDTFLRRGEGGLNQEQRGLLLNEYRDLSVGTNSAGGFTVPPGFLEKITDALKAYGGMLQVANVINTESGQPLVWPSANDTGNVGAILAENNAAPTQDITFAQKTLSAYMYTSGMVKVSYQLLNDSAFDLNAWLPTKFAQRIGRAINAHFTNGTGGGTQPTGLIPSLTVGKTAAVGNTLTTTYGDLVDLVHSVDPAYRQNGRFMMADSSVKAIRKLVDGQGRPLWQPYAQSGLAEGLVDSILGYPVVVNQDMPVMAANAKSIVFGDINAAYVIRQVQGVQVKRFDERFADALQTGFLGFARFDGTADDTTAAKILQNSAT